MGLPSSMDILGGSGDSGLMNGVPLVGGSGGGFNPMQMVGDVPRAFGFEPSTLPFVGGLFQNPAELAQQRQFGQIADTLQNYRQELPQARQQALGSSLGAFGPANNMLGAMYGPGAMVDMGALAQNPVSEAMSAMAPQPQQTTRPGQFAGVTEDMGILNTEPSLLPFSDLSRGAEGLVDGVF